MFLITFYISLQKSIIESFQNSYTVFIMSATRKEKSVFLSQILNMYIIFQKNYANTKILIQKNVF